MIIVSIVLACVLLGVAGAVIKLVNKTLADRVIRRGWVAYAVALAVTAILIVGLNFTAPKTSTLLADSLIPFLLCVLLAANVLLLKKTIAYLVEVNTLKEISIIDPVTEVFNRYYLEQRLGNEVARSHRYGSPLAVVMVAIRDFRDLNDEYGHQVSNIAMSKLAKRLKTLLRETDVIASYSAGQFALVLPDTPEASLPGLINRLRSAIDGMVVVDGEGTEQSIKMYVTFGTSYCELGTRHAEELVDNALLALNTESASRGYIDRSQAPEKLVYGSLQ